MLARPNRVVEGGDFRRIVRRGRRTSTGSAVYYRLRTEPEAPLRFGFIVSRAVGGSVERNRLRRRLRAIGRESIEAGARGGDIVVRPLPGSSDRPFAEWRTELLGVIDRGPEDVS